MRYKESLSQFCFYNRATVRELRGSLVSPPSKTCVASSFWRARAAILSRAWRYARRRAGGVLAERLARCLRNRSAPAHGPADLEQRTTAARATATCTSTASVACATATCILSSAAPVAATPVTAAAVTTTIASSSNATAAGLDHLRRGHHHAGHAQPERGRALRTLAPRVGRPLHAGDPAAEHRDGQRGAALDRVGLAGGAGGVRPKDSEAGALRGWWRRRGAPRCGPRLAAIALARPAEDAPRRGGEAAALLGRAALPRGRARQARWQARAARRLPRRRLPARPVLHRARACQAAGRLHGGLPQGLQQLGHQPGPRAAVLRQGGSAAGKRRPPCRPLSSSPSRPHRHPHLAPTPMPRRCFSRRPVLSRAVV